jgi:hypothetical protein
MDRRPRAAPGSAAIEDHPHAMAGRRLMLFVVLLLLIGAMASATVPRERRAPVERAPLPPPPQLEPAAGVVQGRMPAKRSVRANVGDVVRIDVRAGADDVAQVLSLGVSEPVGPGIPGQLVFDADHPGRFPVTLRDAGRRIGTVVVRPAG